MSKKSEKETVVVVDPTQSQKQIAAICYLFFAIGYFTKEKESTFVKFHMAQSLTLLVGSVAITFANIIPFLGQIVYILGGIAIFILFLIGIANALGGRQEKLPGVGDFADNFDL